LVDTPVRVSRGVRPLRRLLREQTWDLRGLDLAGFRCWLDGQLSRWQTDPVFPQRSRIRDLRREHPRLRALERQHRHATAADANSLFFPRLREVEQGLIDAGKAVVGLTAALGRAGPHEAIALRQKLSAFQAKREELQGEQERLIQSSSERRALLRLTAELHQLRSATGLDREEERLERLLRRQGRHSGERGEAFEQVALALTGEYVVPDLVRCRDGATGRLRVLSGVTLGAARTEFDQLVVRPARRGGGPVEVLAVVEAKRNINDLAHGFRVRQENLAWLTGDRAGYDPRAYRTAYFRSGHFDREAAHEEGGETFVFARQSFARLHRDPGAGHFLGRVYLVTRPGTLWGLSSAALAWVSFRVATDERWEPASDRYLGELLLWCQRLAGTFETPDLLRCYFSAPGRARQILLAAP
jgi:hypothetical protein